MRFSRRCRHVAVITTSANSLMRGLIEIAAPGPAFATPAVCTTVNGLTYAGRQSG